MRNIFTDKPADADAKPGMIQLPRSTCALWSAGYLCQALQIPPGVLAAAATDLGIAPSASLDMVAYFESSQVDAIAAYITAAAKAQQEADSEGDDQ